MIRKDENYNRLLEGNTQPQARALEEDGHAFRSGAFSAETIGEPFRSKVTLSRGASGKEPYPLRAFAFGVFHKGENMVWCRIRPAPTLCLATVTPWCFTKVNRAGCTVGEPGLLITCLSGLGLLSIWSGSGKVVSFR